MIRAKILRTRFTRLIAVASLIGLGTFFHTATQAQVTNCFQCLHGGKLAEGAFTTNCLGQPVAGVVLPGATVGVLLTIGYNDNCVGNPSTGANDESLMTNIVDVIDFGTSKMTNNIAINPPILLHRGDPDVPIININSGSFSGAAYTFVVPLNATKEVHSSISHGVDTNSLCNPGGDVGGIGSAQLTVIRPAITVTKRCLTAVNNGTAVVVTYSGTVSNSGDVTLTNIVVVNNQPAPNTPAFTTSSLAAGASVTFTNSYTTTANICGPFTDTLTATGVDPLKCLSSSTSTDTCTITYTPCIKVTKLCNPAAPTSVQAGGTVNFSGVVTNCGNIALTNVTLNDIFLGKIIATIPLLTAGGTAGSSAPYSTNYTTTQANCSSGFITNTVIAEGTDFCNPSVRVRDTNSCVFVVVCNPHIKVYKQVVCVDATGACLPFNADLNTQKTALGTSTVDFNGDEHCTAFCYRITVTNTSDAGIELRNLQIVDTNYPGGIPVDLASFGCTFTNRLTANGTSGDHASCIVSGMTLCDSTENIVTATAIGVVASTGDVISNVSDKDTNNVVIIPFDITCNKEASTDGTNWANTVTIVSGVPTPVSYRVTVHNNSGLPLVATIVDQTLGCGTNIVSIPANGSVTTNLCTVTVTCPPNVNNIINVSAVVDTSKTNICVYTANGGGPVTDTTRCEALVNCTAPSACRVTGGGRQDDPLVCPADVRYVTHGGQVGAPVGNKVCSIDTNLPNFFLGNPCIHGRWTHVRHVQGGLEGNFHARFFDTLDCACLDTNLSASCQFGAGTVLHDVCGDRSTGPLPRKAPANKIAFTGVGDWACPNGRRESRACLFRVDIEDRGEPGNAHALASNKKENRIPDRYRIRIWVLSDDELQQLQGRHATGDDQWLLNFRNCISACNGIDYQDGGISCNTDNTCSSSDSCTAGATGDATITFPGGCPVRLPNIDDGGELLHGNHQIHPAIKDCDPFNPTGPGLAKP